ncbi:hypothetical protein [Amnibacterium kyonggiense]|uniref:Uncharacterized protein n=1 Tax=Amnibacterium kyonggiense TaxID=595671 RepID=A0A4R7FQP1_9MICO|nr:hypothetical protein [Amnibacterium kyonggiense]TDS80107.1 hypothetical protein CLV52_0660 [Amnibacterium kyonggiense]
MLRRRRDDEGAALIAVVVLGFVMMVLIATGLTVATSGLRQAVGVQRSTSALDAAYAGVQDYLARVNLDRTYIKYGNPDDTFNTGTALVRPDPWNPAFGMGAKTGNPATDKYATWATVPGSEDDSGVAAQYRYEVNAANYTTTGVIQLRVTGLSGTRTRTILASLRVKGFVDFGYFTDYEIKDPETFVVPSGAKSFDPNSCVVYAWTGKRPAACSYVNTDDPSKTTDMRVPFKNTDLLYGDAHTNDTPTFKTSQVSACGMVVTGQFETGAPTSAQVFKDAASCTPKIPLVNKPTLAMPATNSAMASDARCLYTGPTRITYLGTGYMNVVSPWTKLPAKGGTARDDSACGSPSALASPFGATVKQLNQDLLYVQNVRTPALDPTNGWATTAKPSGVTCIGADGNLDPTAYTGIGWSLGSGAAQIRFPLDGEAPATSWTNTSSTPASWDTGTPAYGCRSGDLYVSGKVTTLTTAASQNYVWITDDITYADRTADLLGLVGQSSVVVWNPMSSSDDQPMVKPGAAGIQVNLEVDAAIVSVAHTFRVENHDRGSSRGSLEVFGSIAQKFRGSVAAAHVTSKPDPSDPSQLIYTTTPTGYTKAYQYDTLLKTVSPPKFLEPTATSFTVIRYATVPVAYSPDGTKVVNP